MTQQGTVRIARAIGATAAALSLLALAGAASGDSPPVPSAAEAWVHDLTRSLMSPFCPGITLSDCTSPDAARLRLWIGVQAAAGRNREDVEQELFARYGEGIRGAPKAEGFGAAAYWIPLAVFAAGGGLVAWFLRGATRRALSASVHPAVLDPELDRRLDEVLSR